MNKNKQNNNTNNIDNLLFVLSSHIANGVDLTYTIELTDKILMNYEIELFNNDNDLISAENLNFSPIIF